MINIFFKFIYIIQNQLLVVNLTESIPSIHTGPAEFKRMISSTSPQKPENVQNELTEQLFLQKVTFSMIFETYHGAIFIHLPNC